MLARAALQRGLPGLGPGLSLGAGVIGKGLTHIKWTQ
jgi:hypothetical protein